MGRWENAKKGAKAWVAKNRYLLTIASVSATIAGIYINVAINFTHLLTDRTKIAYDRLETINAIKTNSVDVAGKSCFDFANRVMLSKAFIQAMWTDYNSNPVELPKGDMVAISELYQCLAPDFKPIDNQLSEALGITSDTRKTALESLQKKIFSRAVFNYMNAFEPAADMTKESKLDTRIFCKQIRPMLDDKHSMIVFIRDQLEPAVRDIVDPSTGKIGFKAVYPGLDWYIKSSRGYCEDEIKMWLDNELYILVPFLSTHG